MDRLKASNSLFVIFSVLLLSTWVFGADKFAVLLFSVLTLAITFDSTIRYNLNEFPPTSFIQAKDKNVKRVLYWGVSVYYFGVLVLALYKLFEFLNNLLGLS